MNALLLLLRKQKLRHGQPGQLVFSGNHSLRPKIQWMISIPPGEK